MLFGFRRRTRELRTSLIDETCSSGWNGAFFDSQVYFNGASCAGSTAWLNEGGGSGPGGTKVSGKFLTYTVIGTHTGWVLTPITRVAAGIPATIAAPISVN